MSLSTHPYRSAFILNYEIGVLGKEIIVNWSMPELLIPNAKLKPASETVVIE